MENEIVKEKQATNNETLDNTTKSIKGESVKSNFIFNLIIQLLTYIIPLITAPYLSRVLTPAGVGINSYVHSNVSYFTLVIAFGFTTYGTRKISYIRDDKRKRSNAFWGIFSTRFLLFVGCLAIYLGVTLTWSFGNSNYKIYYLVYILALVSCFLDITYLFQGLEKFRIVSIINIISRILTAVCYFLFVKTSDDLVIYILIFSIQSVVIALVCWIFAAKYISRPKFKEMHVWDCMKNGFIFFLPTVAISVYTLLDKTMLGALTDTTEVGYYEQAYKIISLCTALVNAISPIMLSRITYLIGQGKEDEVEHKIVQMTEIYALMAWPMVMGLYAVGRYFYPAFFGEEYVPSVYVGYILLPLILIIPISNQIGSAYYVPRNRNKIITVFFVVGALTNFATNWIFIPMLGAKGAAITSLVAETIISSLFIIFSWKHINYKKIILISLKPIFSSIIMFGVLMLLNCFVLDKYISSLIVKTLISVGVGVIVYCLSVLTMREEMVMDTLNKMFSKVFKKKGSESHE